MKFATADKLRDQKKWTNEKTKRILMNVRRGREQTNNTNLINKFAMRWKYYCRKI